MDPAVRFIGVVADLSGTIYYKVARQRGAVEYGDLADRSEVERLIDRELTEVKPLVAEN